MNTKIEKIRISLALSLSCGWKLKRKSVGYINVPPTLLTFAALSRYQDTISLLIVLQRELSLIAFLWTTE
jgi:hypothetical protein